MISYILAENETFFWVLATFTNSSLLTLRKKKKLVDGPNFCCRRHLAGQWFCTFFLKIRLNQKYPLNLTHLYKFESFDFEEEEEEVRLMAPIFAVVVSVPPLNQLVTAARNFNGWERGRQENLTLRSRMEKSKSDVNSLSAYSLCSRLLECDDDYDEIVRCVGLNFFF